MDIQTAIASVASGESLNGRRDEQRDARGDARRSDRGSNRRLASRIANEGETIDEVVGAATAMRSLATPVNIDRTGLIDMCGTGGDGANLFNVSTAATFVVAAAGGRIAKHGNRSGIELFWFI